MRVAAAKLQPEEVNFALLSKNGNELQRERCSFIYFPGHRLLTDFVGGQVILPRG